MESFEPGESVLLVDSQEHATGWVVGVSDNGRLVDVRWVRRAGYAQQVTTEPSVALRRTHDSDDDVI